MTIQGGAGIDTGDLDQAGVAELFGKTSGFKAGEPNVEAAGTPASVEDDFLCSSHNLKKRYLIFYVS